jgi:hypothetical protein
MRLLLVVKYQHILDEKRIARRQKLWMQMQNLKAAHRTEAESGRRRNRGNRFKRHQKSREPTHKSNSSQPIDFFRPELDTYTSLLFFSFKNNVEGTSVSPLLDIVLPQVRLLWEALKRTAVAD